EVFSRLDAFLEGFDPANPPHPWLEAGRILHILLEHELMHQETLLYMVHQLPDALKRPPEVPSSPLPVCDRPGPVEVPAGPACLGARKVDGPFAWDNESPAREVDL